MSNEKIRVMFATPSLDHRVCLEFMQSYAQTMWLLAEHGIEMSHSYVGGDQFIAKARNLLVTRFLRNPHPTDLFFLDDDVGWEPEAVLRLLRRPEAIVCGAYPQKCEATHYPVTLDGTSDGVLSPPIDGLYRANLAPTGFMRIKRHVLEDMARGCAQYVHRTPGGEDELHHAIFECGVHHASREFWGEDYYFCLKARELGHDVWIDPNIHFTHRGNRVWKGRFADEIAARQAQNIAAQQTSAKETA
jgi:hypothetical protein